MSGEGLMEKITKPAPKNGFIGSHPYNIDTKNRISVSPDFLEILDTQYKNEHRSVITCLSLKLSIAVYPQENYDHHLAQLQEKSILDRNMSDLMTMIEGSSCPQTIDPQGRLRLTDELMKYAGIALKPPSCNGNNGEAVSFESSREVYVKGFRDHFEIWSKERWDKFIAETTKNLPTIQDALTKS